MGPMETLQEIDRRLDAERQALIADTTNKAREVWRAYREPYLSRDGAAPSLELQYKLTDRVVRCQTSYQALAVIGRLGVTFSTEDAERAVEQLGLIMVHAAVIATMEDLGVEPIIALGRELTKRQDVQPVRAAAVLATAAILWGVGREPRQLALVDGLALAIAKALDDCEIGHGLTIEPLELYRYIGAEVMAGKLSVQTVGEPHAKQQGPAPGVSAAALPPSPSARRSEALANLQAAADDLMEPACEMVLEVPIGARSDEFEQRRCGKRPAQSGFCAEHTQTREEPTARHRRPTPAAERACDLAAAEQASGAPADAMCAVFERELAHAEQRAAEGDAFMATVCTEGLAAAIVKHKAPMDPATIRGLADFVPQTGIVEVPPRHAKTLGMAAAMAAWRGEDIPAGEPAATLQRMERQGPPPGVPDFVPSPSRSAWGQGPPPGVPHVAPATAEERRLGVSAATVCPQCAAPMSPLHGDVYACSNGHEHHGKHLAALQANRPDSQDQITAGTSHGVPPVSRSGRHFPPPRKP